MHATMFHLVMWKQFRDEASQTGGDHCSWSEWAALNASESTPLWNWLSLSESQPQTALEEER